MARRFDTFSQKQLKVLTWWMQESGMSDYSGIIADGAIRSGKTASMALSYVLWAMSCFDQQQFGFCSKSTGAFRRNVWFELKQSLILRGLVIQEKLSEGKIIIIGPKAVNTFYVFGGKDERSREFIQGVTLAGCFFDEVALMPQSFVNQAMGRCSVDGAKLWFNCNPEYPLHWFKKDILDKAAEKRLIHLHFTMDDNPSLSEERRRFYASMYSGLFFQRFILGLWVVAEGAIYKDCWDDENLYDDETIPIGLRNGYVDRYIGIDYGTTNPTVFLDVLDDGEILWQDREYYCDSRKEGRQKTDKEYADDLEEFIGERQDATIILDPSAASFAAELRTRGIMVVDADNSVIDGIRLTSTMFKRNLYRVHKRCVNTIEEIPAYRWDDKKALIGKEEPIKEKDHSVDALRYLNKTKIAPWRLAA